MTDSVAFAEQLSPTPRTTHRRGRHHGVAERNALFDVLGSAKLCHLGVITDGAPLVLPTAYGFDPNGPDQGGTLYLHGSVASHSLSSDGEICVTITLLDGLVLARSSFHHSMNYRSAVILGTPRIVTDTEERLTALNLIVDQVVPERSGHLRASTRKELAATLVLALPLHESSVKARTGGPGDDTADIGVEKVWAGVIPASTQFGEPLPAEDLDSDIPLPEHVTLLT